MSSLVNKYGDAGNWCWVVVPNKRTEELLWKLGVLYVWVLLGGFSMATLLILVKLNMQKRLRSHENEDAREAYDGVVYNLTLYISAFIVCWMPAVADRGYYAITNHEILALSVLHASIVPLQGFVNAVIYGKFHIWIGRHALHRWNRGRSTMTHSGKHSDDSRQTSSHAMRERKKYHLGTAKIFITTFDMNWGAFPQQLVRMEQFPSCSSYRSNALPLCRTTGSRQARTCTCSRSSTVSASSTWSRPSTSIYCGSTTRWRIDPSQRSLGPPSAAQCRTYVPVPSSPLWLLYWI